MKNLDFKALKTNKADTKPNVLEEMFCFQIKLKIDMYLQKDNACINTLEKRIEDYIFNYDEIEYKSSYYNINYKIVEWYSKSVAFTSTINEFITSFKAENIIAYSLSKKLVERPNLKSY